jgi:hypothetical protein
MNANLATTLRFDRESGKRDSNPRPQPWQGCALPTELFPRTFAESFRAVTVFRPARYRRIPLDPRSNNRGHGGEGNRTPDLVNAIHALSQLSYAPGDGRVRCGTRVNRLEPPSIALCIPSVNEIGLAKTNAASILQRLLGSSRPQNGAANVACARLLTVEKRRCTR